MVVGESMAGGGVVVGRLRAGGGVVVGRLRAGGGWVIMVVLEVEGLWWFDSLGLNDCGG